MRVIGPVGGDHAVAVERAVRGIIFIEITSKGENVVIAGDLRRPDYSLVHEVPDKAALVVGIFSDNVAHPQSSGYDYPKI